MNNENKIIVSQDTERIDMNRDIGIKRSTVLLVTIVTLIFWSSSFTILVGGFDSSNNAVVFVLILLANNLLLYAWVSLLNIFLGYNEDRRAGLPKEGD